MSSTEQDWPLSRIRIALSDEHLQLVLQRTVSFEQQNMQNDLASQRAKADV
jgi:hypothetical protein